MSSELDNKLCSKHKLEILTIDVKQSTAHEDKYLCIQCIIEIIDIQNNSLVEEKQLLIKHMKNGQLSCKIKEFQRRIVKFRYIQTQVNELKLSINNTIDKIQCSQQQKITHMENELEEFEQKTEVSSFEEDVKVVSQNYRGSFSFDIPKEFMKSIDENSYIDSIQLQLQSIIKSPIFNQINESLENSKVEEDQNKIKQLQLLSNMEENLYKTPSLNILCNKHGKKIIMYNLDSEKIMLSRLACVDCIQSNDQNKYITLSDANFQQKEYLGQTSDPIKSFYNQRCIKSRQIIEILEEIKEKYNSTISDIINRVNTQYSMLSQNETDGFNENIIYNMSTEQINELLSQTDKFQALTEKQFNIQQEDLSLLEIILINFGQLLQDDFSTINKINNIFWVQNFNIIEFKDSKNNFFQEKNHIYNQQSIKQLNLQVQHLKIYQDILNEIQNQYEFMIQKISNLSMQFKDLQLQQFNQHLSKFERDFSIIKKLTYFNKFDAKLEQYGQDMSFLQNQLTECEKINLSNQQIIIDLQQNDGEQKQIISDLRNEKEVLRVKVKQLEQQKTQFEDNLKKEQAELEGSEQQNKNNEEIVIQLQKAEVQTFSQSLRFSTIYKHSSCQVTQNAKVIENSTYEWHCCMCDLMIPKNGVTQFAFKIIEINSIMIGIGFRDIVQSKDYCSCYSIGGGTYNIYSSGHCYNHDQKYKNSQSIGFPFSKNDIIIVEVDIQKMYLKWTKQSTNQSLVSISNYYYHYQTLTIDTSKDLYPCVHLNGKCKIEILNQVFK